MAGYRRSRALWDEARRPDASKTAMARAILYELQPVRFSSIDVSSLHAKRHAFAKTLTNIATKHAPTTVKGIISFGSTMSLKSWLMVAAVILYYFAVRVIHELLDAGPIVMILTALTVIFTVGLGDGQQQGVSAYSVFNRGFERLMGSVDVENLVNQHVGGGMAVMNEMMPPPPPPAARPLRDNRPPPAAARRPNVEDDDDDDNDDENGNGGPNNNATNGARKSGKKARRRDLQQRREIQRQRRAAIEMGLDGIDAHVEVQRLIEEQIAADANR